jgi:hypothetical protein
MGHSRVITRNFRKDPHILPKPARSLRSKAAHPPTRPGLVRGPRIPERDSRLPTAATSCQTADSSPHARPCRADRKSIRHRCTTRCRVCLAARRDRWQRDVLLARLCLIGLCFHRPYLLQRASISALIASASVGNLSFRTSQCHLTSPVLLVPNPRNPTCHPSGDSHS